MAGLFFGNTKGYDFYGIELKNANVRLRFANRTYDFMPYKNHNILSIPKILYMFCHFIR